MKHYEDDNMIREFRNILKEIKKNVIEKTYATQNTKSLNKTREQLIEFSRLILPSVRDQRKQIPISEINELFENTLQRYPRSPYYDNRLEYYLIRDFNDYPMVIDEEQIDFQQYDNDSPIVPNDLSLTELE
jgi:hypothetical protein